MNISTKKFINGLLIGMVLTAGVVVPVVAQAIKLDLSVPIPGFDSSIDVTETTLGDYVRALYVWFVGVAGIIAVVMTMWAGVRWITAAGNQSRIESARTTMNGAVIGLIILLTSYLLLTWINPALVTLRIPALKPVDTIFAGKVFCENLDGRQYKIGDAKFILSDGRKDGICGNEYAILTLDDKDTGNFCTGHHCENADDTCAWTGTIDADIACQDPKSACESVRNPQSQTECDRAGDNSLVSGHQKICRFKNGECKYLDRLLGCAEKVYDPVTGVPELRRPEDAWVECARCAGGPTLNNSAQIKPAGECTPYSLFLAQDNYLKRSGGNCKEPNDTTGAVRVDGVCCVLGSKYISVSQLTYANKGELVCKTANDLSDFD